jgi:hypothetical protein
MNNRKTLVSVHGYAGDSAQVFDLLPVFEHHQCPLVIVSPEDSPISKVGPHICRFAGKRAYVGQDSWDRQWLQLKLLLEYDFDWYLMNDSDSFVCSAQLPEYLFADQKVVYSNEVTDFRIPGETYEGITWSKDYHRGFPLIAMQPPYFMSRHCLEKIVKASFGLQACPITPFIDWWFVVACVAAGVRHLPFTHGASCETVTPNGLAVLSDRVLNTGSVCLHSVKSARVKNELMRLYASTLPKS